MSKIGKSNYDKQDLYSIRCLDCNAWVVAGKGFAGETIDEAEERIKQYKELGRKRR